MTTRLTLSLLSVSLALSLSSCAPAKQPAASAPPEWPPKPTADFLALDRKSQNLAVYDAFWQQIDSNYYDATMFATGEWTARRAQWREEAARAPTRFILYHKVFPELIALMPESHVDVHEPDARLSTDAPLQPSLDEKT